MKIDLIKTLSVTDSPESPSSRANIDSNELAVDSLDSDSSEVGGIGREPDQAVVLKQQDDLSIRSETGALDVVGCDHRSGYKQ